MGWSADPLAKVSGIGKRDTTCDNTSVEQLRLRRNIPCPGHDNLVHWTYLSTNELDLVGDEQSEVLNILALSPSARDNVPL
jgi:hypothetical protein